MIGIKGLLVVITVAICITILLFPGYTSCKQFQLTLADSTKLLEEAFTIVFARNSSQVALDHIVNEIVSKRNEFSPKDVTGCDSKPTSLYLSKIDSTLALLLTVRGKEQVPEEMRDIVKRNTVGVSIRFTHELNSFDIQSIETLGIEFARLPNGEIARSGTIYGAEVPWDKVDDLEQMKDVVRIESVWQPRIHEPTSQE